MKHHRLFLCVILLICVSLSCNLWEATPMVEVLPTEIQQAAQPPLDQPPAGEQPAESQATAAITGEVLVQSVTVDPESADSGTISASVNYSLPAGSDSISCYVDEDLTNLANNSPAVYKITLNSSDGTNSVGFSFPLSKPGAHNLACWNSSGSSQESTDFIVEEAPQTVAIDNPGFESGFDPWHELPDALTYGGQSVDENVVSYSGGHSRKLFLRYGGSYIIQNIPVYPELALNTKFTLYVYVKMPYAGSSSNKVFTLEMVVGDENSHTQSVKLDQVDALSDWTQLYVQLENTEFPVTWISVHAMTNKGNGSYKDFDKPVYVDDFSLEVVPPTP